MDSYQLLPNLTKEDYAALKTDIQKRGVLVPIEVDECGVILDGHHRKKAWQELKDEGIELPDYPRIVRAGMTEVQKRNHVRALNIIRRQLTKKQRQEQWEAMRADGMTYQAIAKTSDVDKETVRQSVSENSLTQPTHITGKDGKKYPATKKHKKKKPPKPPAAPPLSLFAESGNAEEKAKTKAQKKLDTGSDAAGEKIGVHFQSEKDDWHTPPEVIQCVVAVLGKIDLDPCSNWFGPPNVPAGIHYTENEDGLKQEWIGRVYMNPPYGREISNWVDRLCNEYLNGNVTEAVALVPSRTDTKWFRQFRNFPRCFIWGRLKFSEEETSAPFPSMAVYLGRNKRKFVKVFGEMGDIYEKVEES